MVNLEYASDSFYDFYSLLQDCKSRKVKKRDFLRDFSTRCHATSITQNRE